MDGVWCGHGHVAFVIFSTAVANNKQITYNCLIFLRADVTHDSMQRLLFKQKT